MAIDFGKQGFAYTHDLCAAIEHYTESEVRRDPHAFAYRDLDLKHAIERWLYIESINSDALFRHYQAFRCGGVHLDTLPTLPHHEANIARFLCAQSPPSATPPRRVGRWALAIAKRLYARLRQRRVPRSPEISSRAAAAILIHVINAKFAAYLAPITRRLDPGSFAYLTTRDTELGARISRGGAPVVRFTAAEAFAGPIFCSPALSVFESLMHDADATLAALQALKPSCVVVVEGNAPMDAITAQACRVLDIPCYCVQQGWSPYVHNGFRNLQFTEMFVWGRRFAELLRPSNPEQIFRVTGSHAVQPRNGAVPAPAQVSALGFFLQAPCALLGLSAFDAFVDLIIDVAVAHPDIRMIVREHPGYPLPDAAARRLQRLGNVRFSVPANENLADVIAASDMVVSVFSTILLEALAMNVVPLICSIGSMPKFEPDIASTGAAIEVQSTDEARHVLDEIIADPQRLTPIRERMAAITADFFSPSDAAELIAERLRDPRKPMPCDKH